MACGAIIYPGIRHFCRQASCIPCVRRACEARGAAFALRCYADSQPVPQGRPVAFSLPVEGFSDWRRRIHDAIDHRRGQCGQWNNFALIARFDGKRARGVAVLPPNIGSNDLHELLGDDSHCEPLREQPMMAIPETLRSGAVARLDASLKSIFLTVNPRRALSRPQCERSEAAAFWEEPMPLLF